MRNFASSIAFVAGALFAVPAFAQTPAPVEPAPEPAVAAAEPAPVAPAPEMAPAPMTTEIAPAPAEAAPAPAEEETFPAAWFRVDYDSYGGGLQLWAGATYAINDTVGIATDIYLDMPTGGGVALNSLGEFDIGPAFTAGKFVITPMFGAQFDFVQKKMVGLVPQFYVTGGPDPLYLELWFQNYNYSVLTEGAGNYGYIRFFADFKLGKYFAIGPQIEATWGFNSAVKGPGGEKLISLPIGPSIMLTNYGKNNTLLLFGGYEAAKNYSDKDFAGRLTFIHNF
jgi:hypothetical protein